MSNNSALKIRIYPNNKQNSLLKKGCEYRFHYYKALALWWNETNDVCRKLYKEYCEKEQDDNKRKEYSKTLPWPPKKVTKEGLNDTCLKVYYPLVSNRIKFAVEKDFTDIPKKGKDKGIPKNYGDVFRINANYLPAIYGNSIISSSTSTFCKEDFAKAVTNTFKDKKNISVKYPRYKNANTFKITVKELSVKRNNKGRVIQVCIPFLSGDYKTKIRKKYGKDYCDSLEWFDCSLSDSLLEKVSNASAMTITVNPVGNWFVSVSVYKEPETKKETGIECGIDLGIKSTATIAYNSTNECSTEYDSFEKRNLPIEKIMMLEKKIEHLQKIQIRRIKTWLRLHKDNEAKGLELNVDKKDKAHSAIFIYRKHYQSNSFKETEKRIAQINVKITNIRKNFAEQFSRELANKCDVVGMEDLNVKGMVKNSKLARSISRIGFYQLRATMERKVKINLLNRFAPSSQVCSYCGYRNIKIRGTKGLHIRDWICPECGHHHDRDENAASNIRPSNHEKLISYIQNKKNN